MPDCCDPSPDTKESRQVSGYLRSRVWSRVSGTRRRSLVTKSIHVRFVPRRHFRITGICIHHSCCSARSSQAEKTRLLRPSPRTSARVSLPPLSISARRTSARQNVGHAGGGLEEGWGSGYAAPFQTTPTPTSCLTQQVTALLWFDCFYCFHFVSAMIQMFSGRFISHVCSSPP